MRGDDELAALLAQLGGAEDAVGKNNGISTSLPPASPAPRVETKMRQLGSPAVWPAGWKLGASLEEGRCAAFVGRQKTTFSGGGSGGGESDGLSASCSRCGAAGVAHTLCYAAGESCAFGRLFAALRDARTAAGENVSGGPAVAVARVAAAAMALRRLAKRREATHTVPPEELGLLGKKIAALEATVAKWAGIAFSEASSGTIPVAAPLSDGGGDDADAGTGTNDGAALNSAADTAETATAGAAAASAAAAAADTAKARKPTLAALEARLAVVVASDAVYYRLYYLQVTGLTAPESPWRVPAPHEYFGLPGLACNVAAGLSAQEAFFRSAPLDALAVELFGGAGGFQLLAPPPSSASATGGRPASPAAAAGGRGTGAGAAAAAGNAAASEADHPLLALWQARWRETCRFFWAAEPGWARQRRPAALAARRRGAQHLLPEFACHEAPAPAALAAWRDSCRDFPASMYAYAAPTPAAVAAVARLGRGVVEVGAGMGYWAEVLRRGAGIEVFAVDAAPPGHSYNEYHGDAPAFGPVALGGPEAAAERPAFALLLCYPPPASDMAAAALRCYRGGFVMHVGEWRGLTGDASFETALQREFSLRETVPLPPWGTDASHLTVWERRPGIVPRGPGRTGGGDRGDAAADSTGCSGRGKKRKGGSKRDGSDGGGDAGASNGGPARVETAQTAATSATAASATTAGTTAGLAAAAALANLPACATCGARARWRCRLARSLDYCGARCCVAHEPTRRAVLAFAMLDVGPVAVGDVGDARLYQPLSGSDGGGGGGGENGGNGGRRKGGSGRGGNGGNGGRRKEGGGGGHGNCGKRNGGGDGGRNEAGSGQRGEGGAGEERGNHKPRKRR